MKAGTMIASTFLTVGILIVGFFAPEAVTAVVDRRLETETAEFETDSVQVESMEEMSDVLQLVGSGYISFELEYGVVRENRRWKSWSRRRWKVWRTRNLWQCVLFLIMTNIR